MPTWTSMKLSLQSGLRASQGSDPHHRGPRKVTPEQETAPHVPCIPLVPTFPLAHPWPVLAPTMPTAPHAKGRWLPRTEQAGHKEGDPFPGR